MVQRNNSKMINAHMRVMNIDDLKKYLQNYFSTYDFEIYDGDEDNVVYGYFGDCAFGICYDRGARLVIEMDDDADIEMDIMKKALSPIMWYKNKDLKEDHVGPIAKYKRGGRQYCEWNYERPLDVLRNLAFDYGRGDVQELEVTYKDFSVEDFIKDMRFGSFVAFPESAVRDFENFSEFDFYWLIKCYVEQEEKIIDAANTLEVFVDDKIEQIDYKIAYLLQQLRKFGIEQGEPEDEYKGFSAEAEAWYRWWEEGVDDVIDEHPEMIDEVFSTKKDKVIFKPKGSYKDILPIVIEERAAAENDVCDVCEDELEEFKRAIKKNEKHDGDDELGGDD